MLNPVPQVRGHLQARVGVPAARPGPKGGRRVLARVVKLDEQRRRKIRRRRWLKEIDGRLKRLEFSVTALNAEQVAAELVTVGRNLVRVLREFDQAWPTPAADPGGKSTEPDRTADDRAVGSEPSQTGQPEGPLGQVGEERPPPYGLHGEPTLPKDGVGEQEPKAREMTYPEYWQMIATALGELAGQLEQLSVEAVQRALIWHQSQRSLPPYRSGPGDGPPQADAGEPDFAHGRRTLPEGDPGGAGG